MNLGPEINTDLVQIRKIDGLDPVKASITTSKFGSKDGSFLTGKNLDDRNIVLTLGLNPDWVDWDYSKLRNLVNQYFMTKSIVRLVFDTDEYPEVEITGHVETCVQNPFTKDPEIQVSIICPDPLFVASGVTTILQNPNTETPLNIDYPGTVAAGFKLDILYVSGSNPTQVVIHDSAGAMTINDAPVISPTSYLEVYSVPGARYIKKNGTGANIFNKMADGSIWPMLYPGENQFYIITNNGVQQWGMTYNALFGGI
jgi:hypothetical protein